MRIGRRQLMAGAAAFALAGCGGAAKKTAGGLTRVSLRVEWLHSSYHAPFFLGIEKGFYRDAGIELTVNEGRGSVQVVQLVGGGQDQFGFASADAIMRGVGAGVPIKSVANLMPVMGQAIYVRNESPIRTLADLKGKKIAVTPGGTNEALLPLVLEKAGLTLADVQQVSADPSAKVRVFLNGDVDAMIATGWAHSLFDSGGGARAFVYSDYGVQIVGYNLIASNGMIASDPGLVRSFVAATLKSWEYARAHPEEALDALAKLSPPNAAAPRRAGNSKDFGNALRFVGPAVAGKPYGWQSSEAWESSQKILAAHGVLPKSAPVSQMMTNAFMPTAAN